MVFNSYSFLLFFPIVLVLTQLAPAKWRNGLLLVASYVFYASWGKRFCVLLLGLTVLVYAAGLLLGQKSGGGCFGWAWGEPWVLCWCTNTWTLASTASTP